LAGTAVTEKGIMQLKDLKNLRSIYLYQTGVKIRVEGSEKAFPKTLIDSGGYSSVFTNRYNRSKTAKDKTINNEMFSSPVTTYFFNWFFTNKEFQQSRSHKAATSLA
jgi:hypothetical protein